MVLSGSPFFSFGKVFVCYSQSTHSTQRLYKATNSWATGVDGWLIWPTWQKPAEQRVLADPKPQHRFSKSLAKRRQTKHCLRCFSWVLGPKNATRYSILYLREKILLPGKPLHSRALISGPASNAATATGDARRAAHVARRRCASPPQGAPGGPPEAFGFAIYALICARKPTLTPAEPRKAVYHALGCLEEETRWSHSRSKIQE